MSPEQIEMEMPAFRQVIATRQPVSHEIEIPLPGGDVAFVESHLEPVLDSDGPLHPRTLGGAATLPSGGGRKRRSSS
jgi:hypothetical protein